MAVDVEFFSGDLSKITADMDRLAESLKDVSYESEKAGKNIKGNVSGATKEIQSSTDATENLGKTTSKTSGIIGKLGPAMLAAFSVTAVLAVIKEVINFQQEIEKTRRLTKQLTGETGKGLADLTAKVRATAKTFGKDYEEVLKSANALAKRNGISTADALTEINKGLIGGADATGELLSSTYEYAGVMKELGVDAEGTIAIIQDSSKKGIFSDKGIDTLKEAGLALREMTPNAVAALDAIGLSGEELQQGIKDGTITQFEAIQKISERLGDFGDQSKEVGLVLADIFKGAGEDASAGYIKSLANVSLELDSLVDKNGEYVNAQAKSLAANEALEQSYQKLFASSDGIFDEITADIKFLLADGIIATIDGIQSLINWFKETYNESALLRANIQGLKVGFISLWEIIKLGVNTAVDYFKILGAALRLDFDGVKAGYNELFSDAKKAGKNMANALKGGFDETVNGKFIIGEKAIGDEFVFTAKKTAKKSGKKIGKTIGKAIKAAIIEEMKTIEEIVQEEVDRLKLEVDVVFPDAGIDEKSLLKSAESVVKKLNENISKIATEQQDNGGDATFFQKIFGLTPEDTDRTKEMASAFVGEFSGFLSSLGAAREEQAQLQIDRLDGDINAQQEILNKQLENQKNHKANTVDLEIEKLNELNANRKKALDDQKKAVKLQQAVDSLQQASAIATASANIIKGLSGIPIVGQILGVAAVAAMIGSFIAQKARAKAAAQSFFDGGESSGYTGDGSIYEESNKLGRKNYVYHKREFIFENKKTEKNRRFFHALNDGKLSTLGVDDPTLLQIANETPILDLAYANRQGAVFTQNNINNNRKMEDELSEIKQLIYQNFNKEKMYTVGNDVIIEKGNKTIRFEG